jgi:hypothetical protein
MNLAQIKCLSVFAVFAIIGFGPVSPGCLIGMYVVLKRPIWFRNLICKLYENQPFNFEINVAEQATIRKKTFLFLLCLFIVDIAPIPVTPVIAFVIILSRPLWFYQRVAKIYHEKT